MTLVKDQSYYSSKLFALLKVEISDLWPEFVSSDQSLLCCSDPLRFTEFLITLVQFQSSKWLNSLSSFSTYP
jgi:hypothetical protein